MLREFRLDFSPQYVLALRQKTHRATGGADVVPGQRARATPTEGPAGCRPGRSSSGQLKRLFVDRSERRYEFWNGDALVRAGKVAVGAPGAETPTRLFYVQSKFTPTAPILGARTRSRRVPTSKLSDWPGGGVVGVHRTPWPWLLGQAVSHGCVRMANADVRWLRSRMPPGTPIRIVA